ncbi:MAG: Na/Pi symporter [Lentisphaeria bacterium]|nr:Na/Pi symporter [Lentisphaeria bacterium]
MMKLSRKTWITVSVIAALLLILTISFLAGCSSTDAQQELKKLEIVSGNEQCVLPESKYKDLVVRAVDTHGKPIKELELAVKPEGDSDITISPLSQRTDAGGIARFSLTSGKKLGDNYLLVTPKEYPELQTKIRLVNGIRLLGNEQEGSAGTTLPEKVGVQLANADGSPRSGVKVHISTSAKGVQIEDTELTTDNSGIASTQVVLPQKSGASTLNMELTGTGNDQFRTISSKVLSLDITGVVISVLGGLAFFMLGMKMMSDGLASIAGEKMKNILRFCTNNRFMALAAGTVITAVIQSSSASTVMVIGFVNAGLMNLAQSIGVIFGANIGTTVTAQIVAFNISAVAMPTIIIGLVLSFIKRNKISEIGLTLLGFGILFFGMNLMSAELKALADFPSFKEFFLKFDCQPVNGIMPLGNVLGAVLIGIVATVIVQSSSATTGVVIVLGTGGLINLYTAMALILGANVGTTITAQLAAIPANRPARQAALAHTLFNVIGVLMILISFWIPWGRSGVPVFFYLVNIITEGNAFAPIPENLPRHIANAHTLFNILTALLLLPFTKYLAMICEKLLPQPEEKIHFQYLEPHLLDTPALALQQTVTALKKMLKKSCRMINVAVMDNFVTSKVNSNKLEKFNNREEKVDRYQSDIMEYLAQIMRRKISSEQALTIPKLMHCTNDAERIADRAANIIELTRRLEADDLKLSQQAVEELKVLYKELSHQMECADNALSCGKPEWMAKAIMAEENIAKMAYNYERAHIQRMKNERCTPKTGIIYVELLAELVAVSRHLSNIAERAVS